MWTGLELCYGIAWRCSVAKELFAGLVGYDMIHWTLFIVARLAEAHIPSFVGLS